jgi:hypothetical protein
MWAIKVITTASEPDFRQLAVEIVVQIGFRIGKQGYGVIPRQIAALVQGGNKEFYRSKICHKPNRKSLKYLMVKGRSPAQSRFLQY